jgi:hypothetical protein
MIEMGPMDGSDILMRPDTPATQNAHNPSEIHGGR